MAVTPHPLARQKTRRQRSLPRMNHRAEPADGEEARYRAEVERALRTGDDAFSQIERRLRRIEEALNLT